MSTGAGVVLMAELQKEMINKGMKYIETTGIFETNNNAISNWKNYDHIQHKRKRCYRKML
jgi:limonene-1,2-epoxide hydrolase